MAHDTQLDRDHDQPRDNEAAVRPQQQRPEHPATQQVRGMLQNGIRDPQAVGKILQDHPEAKREIYALIHSTVGNAFASQVSIFEIQGRGVVGKAPSAAESADLMADFEAVNGPRQGKPSAEGSAYAMQLFQEENGPAKPKAEQSGLRKDLKDDVIAMDATPNRQGLRKDLADDVNAMDVTPNRVAPQVTENKVEIQASSEVKANEVESQELMDQEGGKAEHHEGPVKVTASALRVRTSCSAKESKNIIGRLTRGAVVTPIGRDGDWLQIEYNGQKAFIHGAYVEAANKTPKAEASPKPAPVPEHEKSHVIVPEVKQAVVAPPPAGPLAEEKPKEAAPPKDTSGGSGIGNAMQGPPKHDPEPELPASPKDPLPPAPKEVVTAQPTVVAGPAPVAVPTVEPQKAPEKAPQADSVAETTSSFTPTVQKGTGFKVMKGGGEINPTTEEEVKVLNAIRADDRRFDPAWLMAAQLDLKVGDATGAFNTETLRAMRAFKGSDITAKGIMDVDFLHSIHKDGEPFAKDANLKFKKPGEKKDTSEATPADKTAQDMGYADYESYRSTFKQVELLGKKLGPGHPFLVARVKLADQFLRAMNPQATTKEDLWAAVGWNGMGNAAYDDNTAANQTHQHTMGLAIDIDKAQNPWMLGLTINAQEKANKWWVHEYWEPVFGIAANLYGGSAIGVTSLNEWSERYSTEELWQKVHQSSESFIALRELCTTKSKAEIIDALKPKYGDKSEELYEKYLKKLPEMWGPPKSSGKERFGRTQDTKSFTNHSEQMVVALRDVAGLAWGGSELADRENGDFMHFDCRNSDFGRQVYQAGRKNRKG